MAFHVRDEATDKAVRQLAKLKGKTLTATIREAVEREYERVSSEIPLIERLKPIQEEFAKLRKPRRKVSANQLDELLEGLIRTLDVDRALEAAVAIERIG